MGKSTIAYELAKRLEKQGLLGASFFYQRGSDERSDPHRVFPTLAWQLAHSQTGSLRRYLIEAVKEHLNRGVKQLIAHQLQDLLTNPLSKDLEERSPLVIIFDALDESAENYRDLVPIMLEQLLNAVADISFPLRILITTRPDREIMRTLSSSAYATFTSSRQLQDVDPQHHDIHAFIEAELKKLPDASVRELFRARPRAIDSVTQKAAGLFLFATIAMTYLQKHDRNVVAAFDHLVLSEPTTGMYASLDKIYLMVLEDASRELHDTSWKNDTAPVLGCIALSREYLTPSSIHRLLGVPLDGVLSVLDRISTLR